MARVLDKASSELTEELAAMDIHDQMNVFPHKLAQGMKEDGGLGLDDSDEEELRKFRADAIALAEKLMDHGTTDGPSLSGDEITDLETYRDMSEEYWNGLRKQAFGGTCLF